MTRLATATLVILALVGCGGGSGSGGPSGVDGTKPVSAVTASEKGALCDWFVAMVGGYGAAPTCAEGSISAPPTKQACIDSFPSCPATVAQLEDCMETIVAAERTCTQQSLASIGANANCQAAAPCFNFN